MPTSSQTRLALVQMRCSPDPIENRARAVEKIREAAAKGAGIVCLPELYASQYFCQEENHKYFQLAEEIPGPSSEIMGALAKELGVVIVASLFERRAAGLYHNTAIILDADGTLMGRYRKMHIPDDPLYYEKFYFTPGDLGFKSWNTQKGKVGVCVCWDQWFPEAARLTALSGAQLLFYPTAIGWHPGEKDQYGHAQHSGAGKRSSAATPSPTAVTSRRSTAWATKLRRAARASSSGGRVSRAIRAGTIIAKAGVHDEEIAPGGHRLSRASRSSAPTGRSCATGASRPTATSPGG